MRGSSIPAARPGQHSFCSGLLGDVRFFEIVKGPPWPRV